MKNPGRIVMTPDKGMGRTYDNKSTVKGKVPVYLKIERNGQPQGWSEQAFLYEAKKLKVIGFID